MRKYSESSAGLAVSSAIVSHRPHCGSTKGINPKGAVGVGGWGWEELVVSPLKSGVMELQENRMLGKIHSENKVLEPSAILLSRQQSHSGIICCAESD